LGEAVPVKSILCPVDGSDFSERALAFAVRLSRQHRATLAVLSVRPIIMTPGLWLTTPAALPVEDPGTPFRAAEALASFVTRVTDPEFVHLVVAEGDIVTEILRVGRERASDLIVMGTHGLRGFDRLMLGSVTEKVLRKTGCPLLAIPKSAETAVAASSPLFQTIVCGVDRSEASRLALAQAIALGRSAGGRVVVVHAFEDFANEDLRFSHHFNTEACWKAAEPEVRAAYEAMVPADARAACEIDVETERGRPYQVLLEKARRHRADLIVVGTAGWNPPLGSTAAHVVRQAECPVLAVPA
jgi:nucleotide-binding universal stress UspA family protein